MRRELQQIKDEQPILANIADAAGSSLSMPIFYKGKQIGLIRNTRIPRVEPWSYGTVGSAVKKQMNNAIANSVLCGIGNSEENTLSEYAKNIGKNVTENLITNKIGNKMFGRNLEHSLGRAAIGFTADLGLNNLEDYLRKK